jgi:hypothetical protein
MNWPHLFVRQDSSFRFTHGIGYSTMDRRKLEKLRFEFEAMKGSPQKGSDIASLAQRLGRKRVNRGKEPSFESDFDIPVLTIPMHGSKDLKRGTQKNILMQLEDDFIAWEQKFDNDDRLAKVAIEMRKSGL